MPRPDGLTIGPFTPDAIPAAGRLLAARHRIQRLTEPGLSPAYEDPRRRQPPRSPRSRRRTGPPAPSHGAATSSWGTCSGARVRRRGDRTGWVEGAGHAVAEPETVRDLYGFAASRWVEEGATSHYAIVPATDPALVEAGSASGSGSSMSMPSGRSRPPRESFEVPPGLLLRLAERHDIPALARIDVSLPEHQARSPVFSGQTPPTVEASLAEIEADFDDPGFTTFVVEHDGAVIGYAVGCGIEVSSEHRGIVRPERAGFLGFAAVLPEGRGLGAGRLLGEAVLAWSRDAGYPTVVTDWRETNLLSSRTWPRLGFRPTFRRLFRAIA